MKTQRLIAVLALLLAWSCSDDDESPPNPIHPNGGTSGSAGRGGSGGSNGGEPSGGTATSGAAGADGGNAGEATGGTAGVATGGSSTGGSSTGGSAGSAGYPSCPSDESGGAPPDVAGVCDTAATWGPGARLPLPDGAAQLVSITPDELTVVWLGYAEMSTHSFVADRASATDPFDDAVELAAQEYVALSPDGLRLVALSGDGGFVEFVRSTRGEAFGTAPVETQFAVLNDDADDNGEILSAAVIAPDDRTLFYLVNEGQGDQALHTSTRSGSGPWPVGTAITSCEFESQTGLPRVPTGVSSDGLTLFYDDRVRGIARAAWRETPDAPFTAFVDLGTRPSVQPNTACDRLFFTDQTGPAYTEAE